MADALFTLVREDDIETTEGVSQETSDGVNGLSFDEIQLIDDQGDPCAYPVSQGFTSLDATHEYTDGSEGDSPISLRHSITMSVDMIDNKTRRRLHEWMQERARCLFTPGYGRNTLLGWRPVPASTTSIPDLTGRHTLDISGDSTEENVWDDFTGLDVMRAGFDYQQRIVSTPGGAGQIFERAGANIADPTTPTGATPATCGWTAAGTGSGTLTITFNATMFGQTSAAGAINVVGTSTTSSRQVEMTLPVSGSGGPTGEGTVNAATWIMGRLPTDALLYVEGGSGDPIALAGDYSNWTRIDIQNNDTSYASGSVKLIVVMPSGGDAQTCNFWIGPTVIWWEANSSRYSQAYPQWQYYGSARNLDCLTTAGDLVYPETGSMFTSFYVPDWYEDPESMFCAISGYSGAQAGRLYLIENDSYSGVRAIFYITGSATISSEISIVAGQVNTIACVWDHSSSQIYHNGVLLGSNTDAAHYEKTFTAGAFRIGSDSGNNGCFPLVLNTWRLDREAWSADRVANEHKTLSNPVALDTIVAARGRAYKIRSIPSQPVTVAGTNYWRGPLVLEQVDYDASLEDITSKE
jgi:hypothetical protein